MKFITYTLITVLVFFTGDKWAAPLKKSESYYKITEKKLQTHVNFLSSEALEGRLTGTPGEKQATQYIADIFRDLGLIPAGDHGTFFQEFNFTQGVSLGKNNFLTITNQLGVTKNLKLDHEWRPLSFSNTATFTSTELVFAGYGITAPAMGTFPAYDSYKNLTVKNKWVIVFRDLPEKISYEQSRKIAEYSTLRYKTFTAKEHGALGIIFVNRPNSKMNHELIPLPFDTSLSSSGIIALSINNNIIDDLLSNCNQSLNSLQKVHDILNSKSLYLLPILSNIKLTGQTEIKKNIQRGRNVLATLKVSSNSARMIVLGAHVDHLGRGQFGSSRGRENEIGMIHAGADDNASGVASILEAAAQLSAQKAQGKLSGTKDILFAAWSGEEFGILGSSHFVLNYLKSSASKSLRPALDAAINLDMVGHLRKSLVLQGFGSSTDWPKMIEKISPNQSPSLITQNDPYLPTDSTSFYLHGVPALNLFTGAHDDYHTPRDTPQTLNYAGIKKISKFLVALTLVLEDRSLPMSFQEIQKPKNNSVREFKIYLGTIPDYASTDVVGVRLSGVAKNSPAEYAGMQQNDVIIELAGKAIHDIYDYTFVLNALHVKEPVKLIVLRGKKRVALTIIAKYRE